MRTKKTIIPQDKNGTPITVGDRVWVEGENSHGEVIEINTIVPFKQIDIIVKIDSDGVELNCSKELVEKTN